MAQPPDNTNPDPGARPAQDTDDAQAPPDNTPLTLPPQVAGSGTLDRLIDSAWWYRWASTARLHPTRPR